jgi:hypothetical protein
MEAGCGRLHWHKIGLLPATWQVANIERMASRICPASFSPILLPARFSPLLQYKTFKVVYRRYAGLYFIFCVDVTDNELLYLETIHLFVEVGALAHACFGCSCAVAAPCLGGLCLVCWAGSNCD